MGFKNMIKSGYYTEEKGGEMNLVCAECAKLKRKIEQLEEQIYEAEKIVRLTVVCCDQKQKFCGKSESAKEYLNKYDS